MIDKTIANKFLIKATKAKEMVFGGGVDFSWPRAIQIETTIACNLKCSICNDEMKNRTTDKFLPFERFKEIIDQLPYLQELNLTGYGEPLLNKDLFRMIKYAKEKGVTVEFATNATLLDWAKAKKIIDSGLDFLIFSIDSVNAENYESIRRGASFDRLVESVNNFMRLKQETGSLIKVAIYSVILPAHLEELSALIDFAAGLGISIIKIRGLVDHTGRGRGYNELALYYPKKVELAERLLLEAKEYAVGKGIKFVYPSLKPIKYQCRMPSQRLFISVEGYVTPCCVQGMDPRNVNFGNVFEEGFGKIWNNNKTKSFRKKLFSKKPPSICVFCPRLKGMA